MSEDTLHNLNPEQRQAVAHTDGPLLILAGAGTGKTMVITRRIAYLINQGLAKPDEILALTFTEKAAGEMEERVDRLLPFGYFDLWMQTFHSFGEKILRENGMDIGLPGDFKLLNEYEQYILFRKNLDRFELDYYRPLGNPTKFIKSLISHFSRAKDEDITPEQYLEYAEELKQNLDTVMAGGGESKHQKVVNLTDFYNSEGEFDEEIAQQEVKRINEVATAYHVYQNLLLENNALDFGDLINYCLKLFRERPAILEKYRSQFKYILLDEFQDTNLVQYELIKMLAAPRNNLVVVGDDEQSIFRFRGASMSNILQFQKDFPDSEQVFLTKNYRSGQKILDLSYDFIQMNNPNRLEYQLQQQGETQLSKKLGSQTEDPGEIKVLSKDTLDEEMKTIVEKISELKTADPEASWDDFAILVRANEAAKDVCAHLDEVGLPYQLYTSKGLYNREVIMNCIAALRVLSNHRDNTSLVRLLNFPVFNFSLKEVADLNYESGRKAWSLFAVLENVASLNLSEELREKALQVVSLLKGFDTPTRNRHTSEVLYYFLEESGYLKYLVGLEEAEARKSTNLLNQFMQRIKKFESEQADFRVFNFLKELDMELEAGEQGDLPMDLDAGPEAIKIMTVHTAKGLEFKYVFIANLVDQRFPTTEKKEPILIPDALIKEGLPEGDVHLEEERRLFYVAMTRAKKYLGLSWSRDVGGKRKKKPSRFLIETEMISKEDAQKEGGTNPEPAQLLKRSNASLQPQNKQELKLPSHFSYTQLADFSNCPYQYYFSHILKIPALGSPQLSFGQTMHNTLQQIFEEINFRRNANQATLFGGESNSGKGNDITREEILDIYYKNWIDDWYKSDKQKQEYWKQGKESLKDFYEKYNGNWPQARLLEKGFSIKIPVNGEDCVLKGKMDRVDDVEEDKIKIVDYKTGNPKQKLEFKDKEQLLLYHMAAEELFNKSIYSLSFYYLKDNSEVEFTPTEEEKEKARQGFADRIAEIKKGEFPPHSSPLCKFCDYKDICEFSK